MEFIDFNTKDYSDTKNVYNLKIVKVKIPKICCGTESIVNQYYLKTPKFVWVFDQSCQDHMSSHPQIWDNWIKEWKYSSGINAVRENIILQCKTCNVINEYAEPNQKDGSYICFNCR